MPELEHAVLLAVNAHMGQKDKAGEPYILHPMRVMATMQTVAERMAAILHDVVEDANVTIEGLRRLGYPEEVLDALACLTREDGETYDDFIKRAATNPMARKVKIADLEDNMRVDRLEVLNGRDIKRLNKYIRSWRYLTSKED